MKKPEKKVAACEDFFLLVVEAHVCSAVMKVFGMSSLEDTPPDQRLFPEGCAKLKSKERWEVMRLAIQEVLVKFVDITYPNSSTDKDDDHVRAYAKEVISLGLLLMEFIDSIREGDGERIIRCWRYFLPLFKSSGRSNYAIEAFNLLFQYEYIFTPRMKQQVMWERTVNYHGKNGKNVSMDLHLEHINRACKDAMGNLGSNISNDSVRRIGQSVGELMKITEQFDKVNKVPQESGRHSRRSVKLDFEKIFTQIHTNTKVFDHVPKRQHSKFRKFQVNKKARTLSFSTFDTWMKKQVKKYEMFYI